MAATATQIRCFWSATAWEDWSPKPKCKTVATSYGSTSETKPTIVYFSTKNNSPTSSVTSSSNPTPTSPAWFSSPHPTEAAILLTSGLSAKCANSSRHPSPLQEPLLPFSIKTKIRTHSTNSTNRESQPAWTTSRRNQITLNIPLNSLYAKG